MPLIKRASEKALKSNIRTEMDANPGKDKRKQNLAIAFGVQRQAKRKKMADGGETTSGPQNLIKDTDPEARADIAASFGTPKPSSSPSPDRSTAGYSAGGDVTKHHADPMGHDRSIRCPMCAGGTCKYSMGGTVKLTDESDKRSDAAKSSVEEVYRTSNGMLKKKDTAGAMANGGLIKNEQASTEERPMPSEIDKDAAEMAKQRSFKPLKDAEWTDSPTVRQAQTMSDTEMSEPDTMRSRMDKRLRDEETDLMSSVSPDGYGRRAPDADLEEGADRQGPMVPDEARQHNNGRKPYAEGGGVAQHASNDDEDTYDSIAEQIMGKRRKAKMMADGGMIDSDDDSTETPALLSPYDHDNAIEIKKELYDVHQLSDQPMDSNQHSPEHDEMDVNDADIVDRIRRKMKKIA